MSLRFLLPCLLFVSLLVAPARAQLVISEVLSAPTSDWNGDAVVDSRDDEWIEIRNDGTATELLDGVFFRDGAGENFHFGFSGSLAPGAHLLVHGSDAVAWQAANGESLTGLSLNNSGDHLELWRDATLLHAFDVPSHSAASERSFALAPDGSTWMLYDGLNPYSGGLLPGSSACMPTPGAANACSAGVPVEGTSISRLKALYGG